MFFYTIFTKLEIINMKSIINMYFSQFKKNVKNNNKELVNTVNNSALCSVIW